MFIDSLLNYGQRLFRQQKIKNLSYSAGLPRSVVFLHSLIIAETKLSLTGLPKNIEFW